MKRILLLFILLSSLAFADDYMFNVNSTQAVDIYWTCLNAVSAILKSDEYMSMLKFLFLAGGAYLFMPLLFGSSKGASYYSGFIYTYVFYLIAVLASLVIFSKWPASTVIVQTTNFSNVCGGSKSQTTGTAVTVPGSFAFLLNVFQTTNNSLTNITNAITPLSLPQNNFAKTGVGGDINASTYLMKTKIPTLNNIESGTVIRAIANDCIFAPSMNKGIEGTQIREGFKNTTDLMTYIQKALNHGYADAGTDKIGANLVKIDGSHYTCQEAYNMLKAVQNSYKALPDMCTVFGTKDLIGMENLFSSSVYTNTKDISFQAGLINELKTKDEMNGVGVAGLSQIVGSSVATQALENLTKTMSTLTAFSNASDMIRALAIVIFPFAFAALLIPSGFKAFLIYIKFNIALSVWGVLISIGNMFLISSYVNEGGSFSLISDKGLSILTSSNLLDSTGAMYVGMALIVGGLPLAWMLVSSVGSAVGHLVQNLGSNFASSDTSKGAIQEHNSNKAKDESLQKAGKGGLSAKALGEIESIHYDTQVSGYTANYNNRDKYVSGLTDEAKFNTEEKFSRYENIKNGDGRESALNPFQQNKNLEKTASGTGVASGSDAKGTSNAVATNGGANGTNITISKQAQQAISYEQAARELEQVFSRDMSSMVSNKAEIGAKETEKQKTVNQNTGFDTFNARGKSDADVLNANKEVRKEVGNDSKNAELATFQELQTKIPAKGTMEYLGKNASKVLEKTGVNQAATTTAETKAVDQTGGAKVLENRTETAKVIEHSLTDGKNTAYETTAKLENKDIKKVANDQSFQQANNQFYGVRAENSKVETLKSNGMTSELKGDIEGTDENKNLNVKRNESIGVGEALKQTINSDFKKNLEANERVVKDPVEAFKKTMDDFKAQGVYSYDKTAEYIDMKDKERDLKREESFENLKKPKSDVVAREQQIKALERSVENPNISSDLKEKQTAKIAELKKDQERDKNLVIETTKDIEKAYKADEQKTMNELKEQGYFNSNGKIKDTVSELNKGGKEGQEALSEIRQKEATRKANVTGLAGNTVEVVNSASKENGSSITDKTTSGTIHEETSRVDLKYAANEFLKQQEYKNFTQEERKAIMLTAAEFVSGGAAITKGANTVKNTANATKDASKYVKEVKEGAKHTKETYNAFKNSSSNAAMKMKEVLKGKKEDEQKLILDASIELSKKISGATLDSITEFTKNLMK